MKFAVAQVRPHKGDITGNIADHLRVIDLAVAHAADAIIFPELSLTGYEPTLARGLATTADDARLAVFQQRSDAHGITIGVGLPIAAGRDEDSGDLSSGDLSSGDESSVDVSIGMVLFQPRQPRLVYAKQYLHADELPFFVPGRNVPILSVAGMDVAPAICYELSVPEHAAEAARHHPALYVASVAKSADGVVKAHARLRDIAQAYGIPVLMCNAVGPSDDFVSAGQSAAWHADGTLLGALAAAETGILLYDMVRGTAVELLPDA